jgi:hypothetical protein
MNSTPITCRDVVKIKERHSQVIIRQYTCKFEEDIAKLTVEAALALREIFCCKSKINTIMLFIRA